jgi:hypothetical protein
MVLKVTIAGPTPMKGGAALEAAGGRAWLTSGMRLTRVVRMFVATAAALGMADGCCD